MEVPIDIQRMNQIPSPDVLATPGSICLLSVRLTTRLQQ